MADDETKWKKQHSAIGPSGAHRWMECHASVKEEAKYKVESGINFYADQGSAAHAIMDQSLRGGRDAELFLNEFYDPRLGQFNNRQRHESWIEVDEEMVEGVQTYLNYVRNITKGRKHKIFVEHTVDLTSVHPDMFGTLDTGIYFFDTKELYVIDFKYGAGYAVDVEHNKQTMSYGVGLMLEISKKLPVHNIVNVIIQPRAHHVQGPIRKWSCTTFDILEFAGDLAIAAKAVFGPKPRFKAGHWCKFCNALPNCQEAARNALKMAAVVFDDENADELGQLLNDTYVVEEWIRAVRSAANAYLRRGEAPTGWEIGQGRSLRRWDKSEKLIVKTLTSKHNISVSSLYTQPKLISPAQAEKLLKDLKPAERKEEIEKFVIRPPGNPVLVRSGKARPFTDASSIFDDEEGLL